MYIAKFKELGEECQKVLRLSIIEEKSPEEIIATLGFGSVGYLYKRKSNCKEKLFEIIQKDTRFQRAINMMQPETYEQIEMYLLGKLSGPDLQAFEQRLASEPDLAKEVSLQREVFDAIRLEGKATAFRRQLESIEKKMAPDVPARRIVPIRRWLALAAGLALLVVAGWWLSNRQTTDVQMTAQALFDANFNPQKSISAASILREYRYHCYRSSRPKKTSVGTPLERSETKYFEQNFTEALALLQQIQVL
ncbi:MAG: hypothetical protein IPM82_32300 [Saprospiraceae bacterium]|nr:hypothetical protein [Saprospiraceae bacterium]